MDKEDKKMIIDLLDFIIEHFIGIGKWDSEDFKKLKTNLIKGWRIA